MDADTLVKCEKCGEEEKQYWIDKYGMCYWCNHKEEEKKDKERTSKEVIESGESSNKDCIFCPWCGFECSEDDLHESTDTYCDVCGKEFHLEIEYTPYYSTSKIKPKLSQSGGKK
jgi:hypothetical protein